MNSPASRRSAILAAVAFVATVVLPARGQQLSEQQLKEIQADFAVRRDQVRRLTKTGKRPPVASQTYKSYIDYLFEIYEIPHGGETRYFTKVDGRESSSASFDTTVLSRKYDEALFPDSEERAVALFSLSSWEGRKSIYATFLAHSGRLRLIRDGFVLREHAVPLLQAFATEASGAEVDTAMDRARLWFETGNVYAQHETISKSGKKRRFVVVITRELFANGLLPDGFARSLPMVDSLLLFTPPAVGSKLGGQLEVLKRDQR